MLTSSALFNSVNLQFATYSNYSLFISEPELEGSRQELDVEKVEGELGDGPDGKGKIPPNVVPAKIPEGGILSIKNASCGVVVFCTIIIL